MWLRGLVRSVVAVGWTVGLLPVQLLALRTSPALARQIPKIYHRGACRILGLKISVRGRPSSEGPVLYAVNHASWLDIVVLGSVLETGFVAKKEVATWPGIGLMAKLQGTIFVDRSRHKTRSGTTRVSEHLARGHRLVLFPEGTSNDGVSILPFRSSFFSAAEQLSDNNGLQVQPVSLTYLRRAGFPILRSGMPSVAWYGDMALAPHLWRLFCGSGSIEVVLDFHPQADTRLHKSRKALARHCYEMVSDGAARTRQGSVSEAAP